MSSLGVDANGDLEIDTGERAGVQTALISKESSRDENCSLATRRNSHQLCESPPGQTGRWESQ